MSKKLDPNQKAFNKVAHHLLKQGCKSLSIGTATRCMYRGANGTRCAIGALIPDRLYSQSMEDSTPHEEIVGNALATLGYTDISFNCALQRIHDDNEPKNWRQALKEFAHKYKLVWPEGL